MISPGAMEIIWTDHARDRWRQRFGEDPLPTINPTVLLRGGKQGFRRMRIVAGPVTAAVDLSHVAKAVITTVFETGLHEEGWSATR